MGKRGKGEKPGAEVEHRHFIIQQIIRFASTRLVKCKWRQHVWRNIVAYQNQVNNQWYVDENAQRLVYLGSIVSVGQL